MGNGQPAARCGKSDKIDPDTGRPLCKLHGRRMQKAGMRDGKQRWKCPVRVWVYNQTPQARAYQNEVNHTPERKAYMEVWRANNPRKIARHYSNRDNKRRAERIAGNRALLDNLAKRAKEGDYDYGDY